MGQLFGILVVVVLAVGVAVVARRRRPEPGPTPSGFTLPASVDRGDFPGADRPWAVVVFGSETCDGCAEVVARARPLESDNVAVVDVTVQASPDLHRKYRIDGVPATLIVDSAGLVRSGILGPVASTELWDAVAEIRAGDDGGPDADAPSSDG